MQVYRNNGSRPWLRPRTNKYVPVTGLFVASDEEIALFERRQQHWMEPTDTDPEELGGLAPHWMETEAAAAEAKRNPAPVVVDELADLEGQWMLKSDPEEYLVKHKDGKHVELAKKILKARAAQEA